MLSCIKEISGFRLSINSKRCTDEQQYRSGFAGSWKPRLSISRLAWLGFLMLIGGLASATTCYAQVGYWVSFTQQQGGIPASANPQNPYTSLEAAEAAAEAYIGWFIPMPTLLPYPTSATPPISGRRIHFVALHRRSSGAVQYEYHADFFGYQFENLSGFNCSGTPAKESLSDLMSFMPGYTICGTSQQVHAVQSSGSPLQADWSLKHWPVQVTHGSNTPYSTAQDSIRARSVGVLIDAIDPKCTACPCETTGNDPACSVGNPISASRSVKFASSTDIDVPELPFTLRYTNDRPEATSSPLGGRWSAPYLSHIDQETWAPGNNPGYVTSASVYRGSGAIITFTLSSGNWVTPSDVNSRLTELKDTGGNRTGWSYFEATSGNTELYDVNGRVLSIINRAGRAQTLTYNASGQLAAVTDSSGRALSFTYYPAAASTGANSIATVTDPAGNTVSYGYDALNNLTSVTYPDGNTKYYLYNEPAYVGGISLPNALTGITNENAVRFATYSYDNAGRAISTEHAGGVDKYTLSYPSPFAQAIVTDPLGMQRTYQFQTVQGLVKPVGISAPCPNCGSNNAQAMAYDSNGNVASRMDFNGVKTVSQFDPVSNLETQRIEASGKPTQRATNTIWNSSLRVPTQRTVVNASNITESLTKWAYNTRGQVLSRCEIDPSVSSASSYICGSSANAPVGVRQTSYTYCEQTGVTAGTCPLIGLVLSSDGARTDVSDVTTYSYYQTTDLSGCAALGGTCHYLGDLYQVTNALGQTTTYASYDKNGRVARMKDANGTVTDMSYHPRGWLLTRTVRANADGSASSGDAITTFAYDGVGQVTKITQPDGAYLSYSYDAAHRLTDITDNAGNTIHYTLDAAGNRTQEQTKDPTSTLTRALSRQYDQLSHLTKTLNAANAAVQIYQNPAEAAPTGITYTNGYDGNGNAVYSADANGIGTEQQYDGLNRLIKTLQDHAGTGTTKDTATQYAYDARDNLRSVTDPDGLVTNYTYDGLGNLTALQSPDTGTSSYTYDAAGNRTSQTDARGVTSTYSYDALNRLTGIGYPTTSLNVGYAYDQANATTGCASSYPQGRLTTITDSSGSTVYCYDRRGNVTSKKQTANGVVSTVGYAYTVADRVQSITYPSGAIVGYTRNALGQITAITYQANAAASAQTLVASASYLPFGPLSQIGFGNGRSLSKSYDQDYAIDKVVSSDPNGLIVDATVDPLGNLVNASSAVNANPPTQSYQYDALYRLTTSQTGATPPSPLESYAYTKTGDRTSAALNGSGATAYAYTAGTHRLQSVGTNARSYDANGNTTSANGNTFSYDDRNRLSALNANLPSGTQATYSYNGKGERVAKLIGASGQLQTATTFVYGESGQLLGEYANGNSQEYIYLDGIPVGIVTTTPQTGGGTQNRMYYVETDQLGTPRAAVLPGATASADTIVWKWDYFGSGAAFGANAPSIQTLTINLRFPGQYADSESGLIYNYRRDYDPTTGRYVESDPAGISAGMSTYAYVGSNPLNWTDTQGLAKDKDTYRWAQCSAKDLQECQSICSPRRVESCRRRWILGTEIVGNEVTQGWKPAGLSCSCEEDFCNKNPATCAAGKTVLIVGTGIAIIGSCIWGTLGGPGFAN